MAPPGSPRRSSWLALAPGGMSSASSSSSSSSRSSSTTRATDPSSAASRSGDRYVPALGCAKRDSDDPPAMRSGDPERRRSRPIEGVVVVELELDIQALGMQAVASVDVPVRRAPRDDREHAAADDRTAEHARRAQPRRGASSARRSLARAEALGRAGSSGGGARDRRVGGGRSGLPAVALVPTRVVVVVAVAPSPRRLRRRRCRMRPVRRSRGRRRPSRGRSRRGRAPRGRRAPAR